LFLIGAVLSGMFGLRGVLQGMAMFNDARDTTGSRAEDGRGSTTEVRIKTGLYARSLV
jgi:hypothetical protein